MIQPEYVQECFSCKPDPGALYWRVRPLHHFKTEGAWKTWSQRYAGMAAGCLNSDGYLRVGIGGKKYPVHRIIWCLVTGAFPEHEIDHKNHIRSDNRWDNLREVTSQDNDKNRTKQSNNTSGHNGVGWHKQAQKWHAQIWAGGRRKHLGYFDTIEEAVAARKAAEVRHNFHPNHGSPKSNPKPQQPRVTPRIAP